MLDPDSTARTPPATDPMVSPLHVVLRGHCPRCGKGALITSIAPLRPLKSWFIASQYLNKASEGRLVGTWYSYGPDKPGVTQPAHPW